MSDQPATPPDQRPQLLTAAAQLVGLARDAGTDLDRPTPCAEFTLRELLGHGLSVLQRTPVILSGGDASDVPHVQTVPDDDYPGAYDAALDELRAALPTVDLSATITAPFGTMPAGAAVGALVGELTTHVWDLAATLDQRDQQDEQLAAEVLTAVQQMVPARGREAMPFGEVVEVPAHAPASDQLAGWMGRDPAWRP